NSRVPLRPTPRRSCRQHLPSPPPRQNRRFLRPHRDRVLTRRPPSSSGSQRQAWLTRWPWRWRLPKPPPPPPPSVYLGLSELPTATAASAAVVATQTGAALPTTEADLLIDELKRQLLEFDNGVRVEVKTSRKRTKNASEAGSSESPATSSSSVSQDDGSESGSPVEKSARLSAILPADDSSAAAAADCFSSCCSVCGCLAPPTCLMVSRLTGQPVASIPPY
uniref:Shootin-1 n=1 Tax=Macrostomum lignano TaxID=282301 RepID=A0A1I8IDU5_9PLAT